MQEHFVELSHSLHFDQSSLVDIKVVPILIEINVDVIIKLLAGKSKPLFGKLLCKFESSIFIDPILSELPLILMAALTVASTALRALVDLFAFCLEIEAASAVASAIRIIGGKHWITFHHQGVPVPDETVH